jgi:hypothetical protein
MERLENQLNTLETLVGSQPGTTQPAAPNRDIGPAVRP